MVKVLVATTEAQGQRPDDYVSAVDGELVYVPFTGCAPTTDDGGHAHGGEHVVGEHVVGEHGGCDRGFAGMASNRGTTTALVVERLDLTVQDLFTALGDSLERQGRLSSEWTPTESELFRRLFQRMLATASHFPIGSIVERSGEHIRRRAQAEPLSVPSDLIGGDG